MKTYSKKKFILVINNINKILIEDNLLYFNENLLIGFSGGQDSFCLFLIFYQLKNQWSCKLNFIYCNHLWQIESFYIEKNNFKFFYLFKLDFLVTIPSKKILNEEKARKWRFICFKRIKYFYQYTTIITGHTGSDRLETLLFNFFRGSSPEGLLSLKSKFNSFKNFFLFTHFYFFKKLYYKIFKTLVFPENEENLYYNKNVSSNLNFFIKTNFRFKNILIKKKHFHCNSIKKNTKFEKKFYYFSNKNLFFQKIKKYKIFYLKKNYFRKNKIFKLNNFISIRKKYKQKIIFHYLKYLKIYYSNQNYKKYKIIRPFLYFTRFDTKLISCSLKVPLYNDKSNENLIFFRNRIRKQIFPLLRIFFNPQIDNLFFQFSELTNSEQMYFNFLIKRLKKYYFLKNNSIVILNLSLFKTFPKILQGKFLKKIIQYFIYKKIKYYHLNLLLKKIKKKKLSKKKLIFTYNKKIFFFDKCFYYPEIGIIYFSSFFLIIFFNKKNELPEFTSGIN
uniref:tRNA(Ile)-lysidine synthase, chloroplastic n=1 Tax=Geminella minor TaxID=163309 RepID=A0A097KQ59_GEMMI|nr:hypothetical chloroplast RF62 [Geminella minor]AIT95302.1 hypothetical chloroplast RF62 [Geminella minor]